MYVSKLYVFKKLSQVQKGLFEQFTKLKIDEANEVI